MTVKFNYVNVGYIVGGDIRRVLVLNTRKFAEAAAYCKEYRIMDGRAVKLDTGSRVIEADYPVAIAPAIEAWAAASYPGAEVYYMPYEVSDKSDAAPLDIVAMEILNAEGAENGDF